MHAAMSMRLHVHALAGTDIPTHEFTAGACICRCTHPHACISVCMQACLYLQHGRLSAYTCIWLYSSICSCSTCIWVHALVGMHLHMHMSAHECSHACVCSMHVFLYVCLFLHTCTSTYTQPCMYFHASVCMHVQGCTSVCMQQCKELHAVPSCACACRHVHSHSHKSVQRCVQQQHMLLCACT